MTTDVDLDHDDDEPLDYEDAWCRYCWAEGWIVDCIDDMCHGSGECIHGDGNAVCPCCGGDGVHGRSDPCEVY